MFKSPFGPRGHPTDNRQSLDRKSEQEVTPVDDIKTTTDSAGILEQDQIYLAPSATNQVESRRSVPKADAIIVIRHSSSESNENNEMPLQDEGSSLVQPDLSKELIARQKKMTLDCRAENREKNRTQAPLKATATTSNREPPDTTAVLSIAPNYNDNHRVAGSSRV